MPLSQTSGPSWQSRIAPLSGAELNAKISDRIAFLEGRLQDHGLTLTCGAEQEFVLLGRDGKLSLNVPDMGKVAQKLENGGIGLLERAYTEDEEKSKYEVVIGTKASPAVSCHPVRAIASEVGKLRSALDDEFQPHATVSLAPSYPGNTTAVGLHMNYGLIGIHGDNLFPSHGSDYGDFTPFAEHCARNLVEVQKQGLAIYGQDSAFYDRLARHTSAPTFFGVLKEKGNSSVALRGSKNHVFEGEDCYNLEDRLAGGNANPFLAALAGAGALYHTVETLSIPSGGVFLPDVTEKPKGEPEWSRIPRDPERTITTFRASPLWKEIAGSELQDDIANYLAAQHAKGAGRVAAA